MMTPASNQNLSILRKCTYSEYFRSHEAIIQRCFHQTLCNHYIIIDCLSYLQHIPSSDGVVIITGKQDTPTFGEVEGRGSKHDAWFGVNFDLLVSPQIKQVNLKGYAGGGGAHQVNNFNLSCTEFPDSPIHHCKQLQAALHWGRTSQR